MFQHQVRFSFFNASMEGDGLNGVMVSVLAFSVEGHGINPRPGQTNDIKIGICCFSAKHSASRSKGKDWWIKNQNNVSG